MLAVRTEVSILFTNGVTTTERTEAGLSGLPGFEIGVRFPCLQVPGIFLDMYSLKNASVKVQRYFGSQHNKSRKSVDIGHMPLKLGFDSFDTVFRILSSVNGDSRSCTPLGSAIYSAVQDARSDLLLLAS